MVENANIKELSPRKVYTYNPPRVSMWVGRIFVVIFVLLAFSYIYIAIIGSQDREVMIGVAIAWALLAVWQSIGLTLASRARLVTTPEGLEFLAPGYHMRSTWDNVEEIRIMAPFSLKVLHLRQKGILHRSNRLSWVWFRMKPDKIYLSLFQRSWEGQLEEEFKHYAPQLFST